MPHLTDEEALAQSEALDEAYADATGPAEQYERDLMALVQAARLVVAERRKEGHVETTPIGLAVKTLSIAIEQFEPWLEGDDNDPRANGWVDDKGRP